MPTEPYTPAELEAACKAVHELEDMTVDRHLSVKHEVAAALDAVLPDHDARVRGEAAEELRRMADELDAGHADLMPSTRRLLDRHANRLRALARAHATTEESHAD